MASLLRNSIKSPGARAAFMTPMSSKPILKRPAPLPLSPSTPFPFAAHVRFAGSPLIATFSAETYDRAPISVSPASAQHSSWANRLLSPSANTFKLGKPPKRTSTVDMLTVPSFEDPRSPKPYQARKSVQEKNVPTAAPAARDTLAPPSPFVDPRSPKPYCPRSGVQFEELVLHVPRGNHAVEDLGKALSFYPRSPYPSAPIVSEEEDFDMADPRGRTIVRPEKAIAHSRARSLDINASKSKRRQTPHTTDFLSPVTESPGPTSAKPAPLNLVERSESHLSSAFWKAVTLEEAETPLSAVGNGLKSPALMFGNQDGSLWSPRPRKREYRGFTEMAMLSPAQRKAFRKGAVASPSPNDPFAAFPSFTVSLMNMDGVISYPPRARVEQ